jgi:hypothetical protein
MRNPGRPQDDRRSPLAKASVLWPPMALIASSTFCPSAHINDDQQRDGGRFAIEPHAHHRAVENEPHDRLIGQRADVPPRLNRSSPCARPGAPCPCRPRRRTGHRSRGAHGACWCRQDISRRSAHRLACGADRPAAPGSSTRWSCRRGRQAGRAAPRSPLYRMSAAASVTAGHGGDR